MECNLAQVTAALIESIKVDGYKFSPSQLEIFTRIGTGEITFSEAREGFLEMIKTVNEGRPEWFGEPTPVNPFGILDREFSLLMQFNFWLVDQIEKHFVELLPPVTEKIS